ncbi:helix-turn-helix domain-containing protein [Pedobacter ureilyticus]|uniref:Helix-turn-helix domain-containing protein n=1 Tax=Pedobacter ureilyticus TaxID=1393051 RepID=A0ABW9J396_9SPHI|nr:helix-turn-helix domain-containing protein [Pedobacter helvus]
MQKELFKYLDAIVQLQQALLDALLGIKPIAGEEEWLDNADMKQLLKISDATLYRLRKSGQLLSKKIGGKWFYAKSAIVSSIKQERKP